MNDAGVAPPGLNPIQNPMMQLRRNVRQYRPIVFQVSKTTFKFILVRAPSNLSPSSTLTRISPIPKSPITATMKSNPDISGVSPNVSLSCPVTMSSPTAARMRPTTMEMNDLTGSPPPSPTKLENVKAWMAKNSGGPKCSATSARSGAKKVMSKVANSAPQYSEVSRMIADVGGMRNVSGSRMATPLAPPSPGSTPMMVPSVIPTTATSRLNGVIAMWKPRAMFSKPISVTQPGFERSLGQGDQEPALEDDERRHRERHRETEGGGPGMVPDPAHVEAEVERGRQVETEELRDQHHGRRRPDHGEHRTELLAGDEGLVGVPAQRADDDGHAVPDQDDGQPEGKEPALRAVRSPAEPEPEGLDQHDRAQQGEQRRRDDVRGAHPVTWGAVRPSPSGPCAAFRSPPPTWRTRRRWRRQA